MVDSTMGQKRRYIDQGEKMDIGRIYLMLDMVMRLCWHSNTVTSHVLGFVSTVL